MEIKPLILALALAPVADTASGAIVQLASFDFNDGLQGWSPLENPKVKWVSVDIEDYRPGGGFSSIDSSDSGSLFTEVPFNFFERSNSHITSPEVHIENKASLSFYVGFNTFYDNAARLSLQVSKDDFKTANTLWYSMAETGPETWFWHPVTVSLDSYADQNVKFRFNYYSGGADLEFAGGYLGDFAIDNFIITADKEEELSDPSDPSDPSEIPENPDEPSLPDNPDNPSEPDTPEDPEYPIPTDPSDNSVTEILDDDSSVTLYTLDGYLVFEGLWKNRPIFSPGIYIIKSNHRCLKARFQ